MKLRKLGFVAFFAVAIGLLAPNAAMAQGRNAAFPSCLGHSLTVTAGLQLEVSTHLDNQCGRPVSLNITYHAFGPCEHTMNVPLTAPMIPIDVVTFFNGPCDGHYQLRQWVSSGPTRFGEDVVQFDVPAR